MANPIVRGSLDGLSGPYAIVNSIIQLFPKDGIDQEKLFNFIIDTVDSDKTKKTLTAKSLIKNGMDINDVISVLDNMPANFKLSDKKELKVNIAQKGLKANKIDVAIKEMRNFLEDKEAKNRRTILVNLSGKLGEWSCIEKITEKQFQFLDSFLKKIDYSNIGITEKKVVEKDDKHYISQKDVLFLEAVR